MHRFIPCQNYKYDVPVSFVTTSPSFEAVYCFICGRRNVTAARCRMICLPLVYPLLINKRPALVVAEEWLLLDINSLSPRNRVGGDIVTRPFVGGWVSEWVSGFVGAWFRHSWVVGWVNEWVGLWVRGSVTLYFLDTIATTVFAQSLSNFTCTFAMMRGGTLLILGHGVKGQGQLWHSVHKTLWTR